MKNNKLICIAVFMAALCGACAGMAKPDSYAPPKDGGTANQEAQRNFDHARILWKNQDVCSDPAKAIEYLDKAVALDPAYAEAYTRRAMAKSDLDEYEGAFEDATKAVRLAPTAQAYAYRGLIFMRSNNFRGARKDYDRSLELNSSQHQAWNFRGALGLLEGDKAGACSDFNKACGNGDCNGLQQARKNGDCK